MVKGCVLQIIWCDSVDSTQKYLTRELKNNKLFAPVAVVADVQTEGIGSRGNKWESQEGNLFCSFCIPCAQLPHDLKIESASIYFSYLLKETLAQMGSKVWIKWPNDFYIENKKAGGMITSLFGDVIVCGVGLNLKNSPQSFCTLDIIVSKKELLSRYFANLEKKVLWKQVFSKYKLEFYKNKSFFTHLNNNRISLEAASLCEDGSLEINGERIYSLR
jgi:BirA family biotin operon repressor/biotin-[acetyl-CoA-carboxylase] ligase